MTDRIKNRENLLNNDKNTLFLKKWEKHSKRFGKKTLLDLFQGAYNSLDEDASSEQFKWKFDTIIINALKEKKNILFFDKNIYRDMMSLFGKFSYSIKKYGDELYTVLGSDGHTYTDKKASGQQDGTSHTNESLSDESRKEAVDKKNILDEIDLEELYAYDPNENWWNR